ncbi:MAG: hypothetical protein JJD98_00300 [Polaromonas sp.]|nr:hypothetical protein [Polaromonas sp.]
MKTINAMKQALTYEDARKIAFQAAKAFKPSYFTGDDFEPHPWVVHAVISGSTKSQCEAIAREEAQTVEPVEPNDDHVICPNCCNQFRAIPVNVQRLMLSAGFEPPFTHPAPPPSGEREALINRARVLQSALKGSRVNYAVEQHAAEIIHEIIDLLSADAQQVAVPHGWKLVPIKMTDEMFDAAVAAAREYMERTGGNSPRHMHAATIAAAPQPPQPDAPEQQPIGYVYTINGLAQGAMCDKSLKAGTPFYARSTSHARELSDAEITSIAYDCNALPEVVTDKTLMAFARAVIAARSKP